MKISGTLLAAAAVAPYVAGLPNWPSTVDEMEDIMYLNTGYRGRGLSAFVTPCSKSDAGPGRVTAAEFLRTGFHDMATFNNVTNLGGCDGSIMYETQKSVNVGAAFNSTLQKYGPYFTRKSTIADMIALGVYTSVRACGGPVVQTRFGRIDAQSANPDGVPTPSDGFPVFRSRFLRMGFDYVPMIQMVACGHTLGGVHAGNFPDIVTPGSVPNDFATFDGTQQFDSKVITDYLGGNTTDPLVITSNRGSRVDLAVFSGDNNATVRAMAAPAAFASTCATILQKMMEAVPTGVPLSDPVQPYEVKPYGLTLSLLADGTSMTFSGDIRIRTTSRPATLIAKVELKYKDRTGGTDCGSCIIATTTNAALVANGFDDTFQFSANLLTAKSISSFTVVVTLTSGAVQTYDNNGAGYAVQDSIILQKPFSCYNSGTGALTVVAAVRNTVAAGTVNFDLDAKVPRAAIVPDIQRTSIAMTQVTTTLGLYTLYKVTYTADSLQDGNTKFDVSTGTGTSKLVDEFKGFNELPTTCGSLPGTTPTAPANKATIGTYAYDGCWSDTVAIRTFADGTHYADNMTNELCAQLCSGFNYFGTEYSKECYCGTVFNPQGSSALTPDGDCSMLCAGDSSEYCGAGNRLTVYKLNGSGTGSSSSSSSSSTSTTPTPTPTTLGNKPTIGAYSYNGCILDSVSVRTLNDGTHYSNVMTNELCSQLCAGFTYFGTEYSQECYCGNAFNPQGTPSLEPDSDCNMICPGNNLEYCGAGNRLTVYKLGASSGSGSSSSSSSSTTSTTSTPTASQTAPAIKQNVGAFHYVGCQTDTVSARTLNGPFTYDSAAMTLEKCATFCAGYKYFGTEYSAECYCGNSLGTSSGAADTDCSMTCTGNNLEFCGAGNRLSLYST